MIVQKVAGSYVALMRAPKYRGGTGGYIAHGKTFSEAITAVLKIAHIKSVV